MSVCLSVSQSVHFQLNGKVVLYRGDNTRNEFQEEEKTIFHARLAPVFLNSVNHFLHNSRVVARMNAKLVSRQFWVGLKCDSLARVVSHNVLEHLILCKQVAILRVALQP